MMVDNKAYRLDSVACGVGTHAWTTYLPHFQGGLPGWRVSLWGTCGGGGPSRGPWRGDPSVSVSVSVSPDNVRTVVSGISSGLRPILWLYPRPPDLLRDMLACGRRGVLCAPQAAGAPPHLLLLTETASGQPPKTPRIHAKYP